MIKTKVIIDGVTIKDNDGAPDPNLLINYEFDKDVENEVGEIAITCPQTVNDLISLSVGKTVIISRGETTSTDEIIFEGSVSNIKPRAGIVEITARSKMWDLVRKNVNKVYDAATDLTAGVNSAIVEDLIETYGNLDCTVVATGSGEGQTINQFKCINTDIFERVQALKKAANYQLREEFDPTHVIHYEPRGYTDSGKTITVGTEIIGIPEWDYDTSQMINNLRVDGATILTELRLPDDTSLVGQIGTTSGFATTGITLPNTPEIVKLYLDASNPPTTLLLGGGFDGTTNNDYYVDKENKKVVPVSSFTNAHYAIVEYTWAAPAPIRMRNQTSIDANGEFEKQLTFSDISSIADAESRAIEILARFSQPFLIGKLLIKNTEALGLKVGDLVTVVDNRSKPNVNREMVITHQKIKYPGDIQEITVGDSPLKLQNWNAQTEDRIKRLEEELIRNQDLVVELIQVNNQEIANNVKTHHPRYRTVSTQAYTTGDNTMIWNNVDHGIWNTDNWATGANPDGFEAEATYFIQNFNETETDQYLEQFVDNDFKSATTSATWGSGTVSFTSAQNATSTSIDYNNGTITAATLTATESSGSFEYFMNANGTRTQFNTGTVTGATWGSGTVGTSCLVFDGVDDTVSIANNSVFNTELTDDLSISVWVNRATTAGGSSSFTGLVGRGGSYNPWGMIMENSFLVNFSVFKGTSDPADRLSITSNTTIPATTWTHVVGTWNHTTGDMKLYFNGSLHKTVTHTPAVLDDNTGTINVGGNGGNRSFKGSLDEARIYNIELDSTQVSTLYAKGNVTTGLVAKYSMEEGSGNYAFDTSQWERVVNGVSTSFITSGTDLAWKVVEKAGSTGALSQVLVSNYH